MGKSSPKAPPPPDYAAAARAQGQANLDAANQGAVLSNPNIISPYGNQNVTWAQNPNSPGGGYQATVTQSLTPAAQAALDAQQRVQLSEANLADQGINKAAGLLGGGFQYQGPHLQTSLGGGGQRSLTPYGPGPDYATGPGGVPLGPNGAPDKSGSLGPGGSFMSGAQGGGLKARMGVGPGPGGGMMSGGGQPPPGDVDYGPRADTYGLAGGINASDYGQAQSRADLSNVAAMPINAGTTAQQAILQRLQPQIEQNQNATAQRLANQGIPVGSEAWNNEMRQQGQQQNDLYSQAALQGINLDLSANEQGFNQAQQNAGLYNSALAQNFGQGLQGQQLTNNAIGQNFGQGAQAAGLYNSAQNQLFNQNLANRGQDLAAQNQGFNQNLQRFGAENAAQQADWQQQLAQYNQPLNQVTALMSGSQIQNPQFQSYQGQNVAAAPVFQGVQAQGQYALDTYGQQMAARNAQMQALGNLGGAAASFIPGFGKSDFRLKSNIVRTGEHPLGIGIYEYDIDGRRERGVMAHELAMVKPEAVAVHPDGYLMVDYGQLEAA